MELFCQTTSLRGGICSEINRTVGLFSIIGGGSGEMAKTGFHGGKPS